MNFKTVWRAVIILLLALIIGRFLIVGMPKILFNQISSDGDESAYLSLGLALGESGTLSDGTRPPLYALLLSPFAERDWRYFTTAKLVTLGIGALTIVAIFAVGVRLFSWETALLAAFLLAANKEFHIRAATVYADTLLALVMVGAWYFLIKSVAGWKNCILAGVFVGLAFLTKGSAPVLLAAWGLMALFHFRGTVFRHVELLLVPLVFVIISLPLLIFNANQFGSPTYNFATQHIMWMDELAQINTADPENLPTIETYFATHTTEDMVARVRKGLRRLNPVIARSLNPGRDFDPVWLGPALGLSAVGALLLLITFRRQALVDYLTKHKNPLLFTFFLGALFYTFFTWYVAGSSAETRFVVPLLGPLYLVLADVIVSLARGLGRWLDSEKIPLLETTGQETALLLYRATLVLVIAGGVWWLIDTARFASWALTVNPYQSDRSANAEAEQIVQWLARDNPHDEALVAFGPSKSLPLWKIPARFTIERLPYEIDTWPAMQAYVQRDRPDYMIIDDDTARRRRQALAGHFQRDNELVMVQQIPSGWALDYVYPGLPCRWCIFSPAMNSQPLATLEDEIELLDRGMNEWQTPAGQRYLRVRLTWRAQTQPELDYTIFVHLTAPDGFVKAQHDQQPFNGAWPTSQWSSGEVLADRYDLPLDEGLIPGDYLLLAGMYDPDTGQRLQVIEGPTGPVSATVLLDSVQMREPVAVR